MLARPARHRRLGLVPADRCWVTSPTLPASGLVRRRPLAGLAATEPGAGCLPGDAAAVVLLLITAAAGLLLALESTPPVARRRAVDHLGLITRASARRLGPAGRPGRVEGDSSPKLADRHQVPVRFLTVSKLDGLPSGARYISARNARVVPPQPPVPCGGQPSRLSFKHAGSSARVDGSAHAGPVHRGERDAVWRARRVARARGWPARAWRGRRPVRQGYRRVEGASTSGNARRPCWPAPCGRCRPCA